MKGVLSGASDSRGKIHMEYKRSSNDIIKEELENLRHSIEAGHDLSNQSGFDFRFLDLAEFSPHAIPESSYVQMANEFTESRRLSFPPSIINLLTAYSSEGTSLQSGILPQLNVVWFAFNTDLYLWQFEKGETVIDCSGLIQTPIENVVVFPADHQLFARDVAWGMIISSQSEQVICGVISKDESIRVFRSDYSFTTSDVKMNDFAAFPNLRLFIGGSDGRLDEIQKVSPLLSGNMKYKKKDITSYFLTGLLPNALKNIQKKSVKMLAADTSRNILYALVTGGGLFKSESYQIDVYDLGPTCTTNKLIFTIDQKTLYTRMWNEKPQLAHVGPERLEIVHIYALERHISRDVNLVALARNGVRVYIMFDVTQVFAKVDDELLQNRPSSMFHIHTKLPPQIFHDANDKFQVDMLRDTPDKPTNCERAIALDDGTLVTIDGNYLYTIRRSLSRIASMQGDEYGPLCPEESVSCVSEVTATDIADMCEYSTKYRAPQVRSEICGHVPRSDYALFCKPRYLTAEHPSFNCLTSLADCHYNAARSFLILSSSQLIQYVEVRPIDFVYRAITQASDNDTESMLCAICDAYGKLHICLLLTTICIGQVECLSRANEYAAPDIQVRDKARWYLTNILKSSSYTDLRYSSAATPLLELNKFRSLYIITKRILAPVWNEQLTIKCEGTVESQIGEFSIRHYSEILEQLEPLQAYIVTEAGGMQLLIGNEQNLPVYQLNLLITRTIQVIRMLSKLTERYLFRRVVAELARDDIEKLAVMTFKDMICSFEGHELAKSLITSYVRLLHSRIVLSAGYTADEALSYFQENCPAFFSDPDRAVYEAIELLNHAIASSDMTIRDQSLRKAFALMNQNIAALRIDKIKWRFMELGLTDSFVKFCAMKINALLEFDSKGHKNEIDHIYSVILDLVASSSNFADEESLILTLNECLKVENEQLHISMFDWMFSKGRESTLVKLTSRFLKSYLQTIVTQQPYCNMLANYSHRNEDTETAGKEFLRLTTLSQEHATEEQLIPTEKRNDYIDFAITNYLKGNKHTGELEKIRIQARNQLNVKNAVIRKGHMSDNDEAIIKDIERSSKDIDRELYTFSDLYEKFAKPLDLLEVQLQLLSELRKRPGDNTAIEQTMASIFPRIVQEEAKDKLWPKNVYSMLYRLGMEYRYVFPEMDVAEVCEEFNLSKGDDSPWVVQLLIKLNVSHSTILMIYYKLFKTMANGQGFFKRFQTLFADWFDKPNSDLTDYQGQIQDIFEFLKGQAEKEPANCRETKKNVIQQLESSYNRRFTAELSIRNAGGMTPFKSTGKLFSPSPLSYERKY